MFFSALALEIFRRAVESGGVGLIIGAKLFRSLSNAQYCLVDGITLRAVRDHVVQSRKEPTKSEKKMNISAYSDSNIIESTHSDAPAEVSQGGSEVGDIISAKINNSAGENSAAEETYGRQRFWGSLG